MDIKEENYGEIPLFKIQDFTLYELNLLGLSTLMKGEEGTRYSDRYEVQKINYTDNSQKYLANMTANRGIYRDKIVDLDGDIIYTRDDDFRFQTQSASYNKKTTIAQAHTRYKAFMGENSVVGTWLEYNNKEETARSKSVNAVYKIFEE